MAKRTHHPAPDRTPGEPLPIVESLPPDARQAPVDVAGLEAGGLGAALANAVSAEELSGVLAEIAKATSVAVALKLARDFGGTMIYVPRNANADTALVRSIGVEATTSLARLFAGERIEVPLGPMKNRIRHAMISRMLAAGYGPTKIARAIGCHRRTIQRAIRETRDDRQLALFPDD